MNARKMNVRKGKEYVLEAEKNTWVSRAENSHDNKNSYYLLNIRTNETVWEKLHLIVGKEREQKRKD